MKQTPKEDHDLLYESLLQLNNVEECRRFMEDHGNRAESHAAAH